MNGKAFFLLALVPLSLIGAPASRESAAIQEIRLSLDQIGYQLHSQISEIDLFHERLQKLERQTLQKETATTSDPRLNSLEKKQEALLTDLKTLKKELNSTNSSLAKCQSQLANIDKQLTTDIQSLKKSLQSMLALLGQGEAAYTVKSGDSLGKIALEHKISVERLKKANNLTNNTIFPGQKLTIP